MFRKHKTRRFRPLVEMLEERINPSFIELAKLLPALDGEEFKAEGDVFGSHVAIDGNTAVVGAAQDDGGGSAYIFVREGAAWNLQQKLIVPEVSEGDFFGDAVAISGDTVVVGARLGDNPGNANSGSAYVFHRTGDTWSEQQKLVASDGASSDNFGGSVGISGDTIVVGAHRDSTAVAGSGSAYVFDRTGSIWNEQQKLTAFDAANNDQFGVAVAISGEAIIVGASGDDDGGSNGGAAYVFTRTDDSWDIHQRLTPSDAEPFLNFGSSVAISSTTANTRVIVGAPGNVDGGTADGQAYVYFTGSLDDEAIWHEQQKLTVSSVSNDDQFGQAVSISGDTIVVGAQFNDEAGSNAGIAYVFQRNGSTWSEIENLTASDANAGDLFGQSVAVSGGTIIVGATGDDDVGESSGSVYVFGEDLIEPKDDTAVTDNDSPVNINVLANDIVGTDSKNHTISAVNGNAIAVDVPITIASGALVTLLANKTIAYDPNGQFDDLAILETTTDSFTYTLTDGNNSATATVTVTITGPLAIDDEAVTRADQTVTIDILSNDAITTDGTLKSVQKISDTQGTPDDFVLADLASSFGTSTANIGDLDGDGITDLAVGASQDGDGGSLRGAVYVLFRNADGTVRDFQKISDTQGTPNDFSLSDFDFFGWSVTALGDVDGDSITDLAVGAIFDGDGGTNHGAVYVLFMKTDGTAREIQKISDTEGTPEAFALSDQDVFGWSVTALGDDNGDGIPDLAVGTPNDNGGGDGRGAVYVMHLNDDGTVQDNIQKISASGGDLALNDRDKFGSSVTALGDVDGNGVTDLAVGAEEDDDGGTDNANRGAVYVLLRGTGGTIEAVHKISDTEGTPESFALSDDDEFGHSITALGDVDGNGITDLAVGADLHDDGGEDRGAVYVLLLNEDYTVSNFHKISDSTDGLTISDFDNFGASVTALGDLNGDGVTELAVGAPGDDDGGEFHGALYVLSFTPSHTLSKINDTPVVVDQQIELDSGALVTFQADGNITYDPNSQFFDLAIGETATDTFTYTLTNDEGNSDSATVTVTVTSRPRANDDEAVTDEGTPVNIDIFGNDVITTDATVNDVQKISDTQGTPPEFMLNEEDFFGTSMTPIGDLDGDGIVDLAVGADGNDDGGAVYVLFMNTDGTVREAKKISETENTPDDFSVLFGFGRSVAGLGDINGDGIPDLAVGTRGSAVYVLFLGRATSEQNLVKDFAKISETENTPDDFSLNGGGFGRSVAGLGDINGDGIPDLAVGASGDNDGGTGHGAVYVLFLNRASPGQNLVKDFAKISDTQNTPADFTLNQTDSFGWSVTALDDADGDGISDLAVGAPFDDDGGSQHGAVYVLFLNPVDSGQDLVKNFVKISDTQNTPDTFTLQNGDLFGDSVAGLGDLNGDGIPDLAVAQRAFNNDATGLYVLFLGRVDSDQTFVKSFTKILAPDNTPEDFSLDDGFVRSVAVLGDVNGDGLTDLAIGNTVDDDGGTPPDANRGAAYVLFLTPSHSITTVNGKPVIRDEPMSLDSGALITFQANGKIHYNPNGRFDHLKTGKTATDSFTYTLTNDAGDIETATVTVTLNGRSAPVLHGDGVLSPITEDDTGNFGDSVRDILGDTVTGVYNNVEPGLVLIHTENGSGHWEYSLDHGVTWGHVGAVSVDAPLALKPHHRLRFVPGGAGKEVAFIDYRAWDLSNDLLADVVTGGGNTAYSASVGSGRIDVSDMNDAPVLDTSIDLQLDPIAPGDENNPGTSVADLLASAGDNPISDADLDSLSGIAVTFVDNSAGTWQYSIDGSATWNDFGSPTSGAARLLADDPGNRIRYLPSAGSKESASLRFRAWDQSGGLVNGATADTFANGFSSAYSNAVGTATVTIDPTATPHDPVPRIDDQVLHPSEDKLVLDLPPHGGAYSVEIAGSKAWFTDRDLNLAIHADGDYFGVFGGQERWIMGETNEFGSPWYYLLPSGEFHAWNPSPRRLLRGALVETIEPLYHHSLHLLTEAADDANGQEHLAFMLDQGLNLRRDPGPNDDDWFNSFGMQERWVMGNVNRFGNPSYFITPGGGFFAWDGTPWQTSGMLLATLDLIYYEEPSRLYDAQANQVSASISAANDQLIIDPVDGFAGHMWVELTQSNGVTSARDLFKFSVGAVNAAPEIAPVADQTISSGSSLQVPVTVTDADGDDVTLNASAIGFFVDRNTFQDWGGRNEKWLRGTDDLWYFILPTGEFYRWDKNPTAATGEKLATFDSIYWNELDRLTGATEQHFSAIAFADDVFLDADDGFTGSFWVLLEAADRRDTSYWMFGVTVTA